MSRAILIFCSYSLSSLLHKILSRYIIRGLHKVVGKDEGLPRYDNTLSAYWLLAVGNRALPPFRGSLKRVLNPYRTNVENRVSS